jgi:hypothetical protein
VTSRRAPRRSLGSVVGALLLLGSVGVVAGCTTPRDALGTNASPCFRALPVAADAVGERGALQGVRLLSSATLAHEPRLRSVLSARAGAPVGSVCVFAYRGRYTQQDVQKPLGVPPASGVGSYAVAVVSMPANRLIGTFVLESEPLRFHHYV